MSLKSVKLYELITKAKTVKAGEKIYPLLSMTMANGLVDQADKFKKRVASKDTASYKVIAKGQLVVGFPIDEGVLSFQNLYNEAIVSPAYDVWDIKDIEKIYPSYLEEYLRSPFSLQFYKSKLRSTTARRRSLPKETFLSHEVPLPPLAEQKRIAGILDQADALRRQRQRALDQLNQLGQSIFYEMFGDPSTNDKNWPMATIRSLLLEAKYGTSKKANTSGDGMPILRMSNITYSGEVDLCDMKYVELDKDEILKYTTQKGDILFNRTNSKELVGKTAVIRQSQPLAIAGYLVRARVNEHANPHYISSYLNSYHGKLTLKNMCNNIVGMANINAQKFQDIKIGVPPVNLQNNFARKLDEVNSRKLEHLNGLQSAKTLFASLQQRAFCGEL